MIHCPTCAEPNPAGFVWCRSCKGAMKLSPSRKWPLPPAAIFFGVAAILFVLAIVFGGGRADSPRTALPAPASGAGSAALDPAAARKALKDSLDGWKRAAERPASGTPDAPPSTAPSMEPSRGPSTSPLPPAAADSAPSQPPASPAPVSVEGVKVERDGDRTTYEIRMRQGDKVYPVRIEGRVEVQDGMPHFVPTSVDTGGMPIDPEELKKLLQSAPLR